MKDYMPINNLEAESSVIGLMIFDQKNISHAVNTLSVEDFYSSQHSVLFRAVVSISSKGQHVDILSVVEYLKSVDSYSPDFKQLFENLFSGHYTLNDIKNACNIVLKSAIVRKIQKDSLSVLELIENGGDYQNIVDFYQKNVISLATHSTSKPEPVGKHAYDVCENLMKHAEGAIEIGVKTGFKRLDEVTGGLRGNQLVIVAARPSVGKTTFVKQIALNVEHSEGLVLFFSLEMSRAELIEGIFANKGQINIQDVKNRFDVAGNTAKIGETFDKVEKMKMLIDDNGRHTVDSIVITIRSIMMSEKKLDLIIIDYLQLIRCRGGKDRHLQIAEITRELKTLSGEIDVPIILLSQLNRNSESRNDKRPQLSDLKESGAIEQDADLVVMLYRPEMYDMEDPELRNVLEGHLVKHRSGGTGNMIYHYKKEYQRIHYMEKQEVNYVPM